MLFRSKFTLDTMDAPEKVATVWDDTFTSFNAVSYTHLKIEQGKAEGSPEVLRLLLQRLGVEWRDDPDFCLEAEMYQSGIDLLV